MKIKILCKKERALKFFNECAVPIFCELSIKIKKYFQEIMMKLKLYTVLFVMVSLFLSNCGDKVDEGSEDPVLLAEELAKITGFDPNGPTEIHFTVFYPLADKSTLNPYANNTPQTTPLNVSRSVLTFRKYLDFENDISKLGPEKTVEFISDFSLNGPDFTGNFDYSQAFGFDKRSYGYGYVFHCNPATDKGKFQVSARLYDSANNEIGAGTGFGYNAFTTLLECSPDKNSQNVFMQLFKK